MTARHIFPTGGLSNIVIYCLERWLSNTELGLQTYSYFCIFYTTLFTITVNLIIDTPLTFVLQYNILANTEVYVMDFLKRDFENIGNFLSKNIEVVIVALVLAVISAVLCMLISKKRNALPEDVIFSGVFGLVFNVLGLLFVIFRKPVWNNLGWIPVVAAWFFIDGNPSLAVILIAYAVVWMISQHILLERIKVIED